MSAKDTIPDPRRWIALGLLCATQFMLVIDVSIINVALPTIKQALHFSSDSSLQWVASAYALTFGGFLLLGGRMADLLGRRRMFIVGLALFSVGSLACGFATTSSLLIGSRALQGLGAALVAPAALSILSTTFAQGTERNKALGVWGAISGAGGAVGVLLGGVLTTYADWSWIFFVNAPIGIIAMVLAPRLLRESRVEGGERSFDALGALSVTASLSLLVFTMVKTNENGWFSTTTIGLLALSAALMGLFIWNESRVRNPLLPLSIFRNRTLAGANIVGFLLGSAIFSMFFLLALYMQTPFGLGYTALRSGLAYLLIAVTIIFAAGASQAIVTRVGVTRVLAVGMLLLSLGLLFFTQVSTRGSYLGDVAPGFLIAGIGLGFSFIPVTIASLDGVSDAQAGLASGLINTTQQIGGAIGVSLLTTVYARDFPANPRELLPSTFIGGLGDAFLLGAGLAAVGVVATLLFVRQSASAEAAHSAADGVTAEA